MKSQLLTNKPKRLPPLPIGHFQFVALDVETANYDRATICQIGLAFARENGSLETWSTYIDPQTDHWVWTELHGICSLTVAGAPTIAEVLPMLNEALVAIIVYQHSGFDRSAISAACAQIGCSEPNWTWRDSVSVARKAWPELKGNGGHGLASLKTHLGLTFDHHDAEEDARAAAEVVLRAKKQQSARGVHSGLIVNNSDNVVENL